jgi:hypothetical protein
VNKFLTMTNATKANVIALVNAALGILITFNVILTQTQVGAIEIGVNAALAFFVAGTYTLSKSRYK